jgi:hypothetical protein
MATLAENRVQFGLGQPERRQLGECRLLCGFAGCPFRGCRFLVGLDLGGQFVVLGHLGLGHVPVDAVVVDSDGPGFIP